MSQEIDIGHDHVLQVITRLSDLTRVMRMRFDGQSGAVERAAEDIDTVVAAYLVVYRALVRASGAKEPARFHDS